MKKRKTRLLCLLLTLAMALTLCACGGDKASSDPNHIVLEDCTLDYKGAVLTQDSVGNDTIVITLSYTNTGKSSASFLWTVVEKGFQNGVELDIASIFTNEDTYETVTDGQLTEIQSGASTDVCLAFILRDKESKVEVELSQIIGKKVGKLSIDPTTLSTEQFGGSGSGSTMLNKTGDPLLDWWNGQWYGWWTLTGGTGAYEEMNNNWWDVSGIIEIGSDYMGTVTLWDEDYSRSNPMVDAAVSLNSAGTGEHGTMMSEGGWFTDIRLEHADWIVDPGLSEFDAMICIDGWYENGDDEYRYEIYLRPWGTYWDDVAEEGRPYLYDDWYIPLIEKNALMPDVIGGEATEFAGGGSQGGAIGGGEATQTGATGGDYGKSNANATGQVSREVMDRAILSLKGDFIWDDVKYEDIRELLGTDGVPYAEFDSWRADRHTYEWFAPERVTLLVAFKVENGEEISNSWTSGSWDGPEYDVTPVKLGSRPEGSGNMIDQSATITDSRQNVEATVMFKIPEGAWCVDPGVRSSFQIINNPTTDNVPFRTPYIKVELFETSESLNYYEKDFENLTELESRTIGGVTMNGRSYKNVGIEWIEFYGQIPSGGWISIRLAYMSADPGSECSNILDSMSFK